MYKRETLIDMYGKRVCDIYDNVKHSTNSHFDYSYKWIANFIKECETATGQIRRADSGRKKNVHKKNNRI